MPSFNQVILVGNVTRDIEMKYTPKGTAVCELGIAINHAWKNDAGEKMEECNFFNIELWGRTAEVAGEYLKKGSPVLIQGRLRVDSWDDKETGNKRTKIKIVGETMQMLGSKPQYEEGRTTRAATSRPAAQKPASKPPPRDPDSDPEEDDIPF